MTISNDRMTVGVFKEILDTMDADNDLFLMVRGEYGDSGIYSVRKHVITNEDGEEGESYVVING